MLWIFLLQIINSIEGIAGADHGTLCTSNACLTLHMSKVNFTTASSSCVDNGGRLMTIKDREEEDVLLSLLSQTHRQHQERALKFWIGLKLNSGNCSLADRTLRGFKWISGEEDSHYSNWGKEPDPTCTEDRCVRAHYTPGQNQLKWTAGGCKQSTFYVCKFNFQGMCRPLVFLGPGQITYMVPFSQNPQSNNMKSYPFGTYATVECSDKQIHFAVCKLIDNIFEWSESGPFCNTGKQNCSINKGGCEHLCHQDGDEVKCVCREGYDLDKDGHSCRIKDLCHLDTCEHRCVMTESGLSCRCWDGFKLEENQRNCSDIDECQSQACGDNLCINTHGSYTCLCKDGYEMIHGKCRDVDECTQSRCEQNCVNNVGSFSCYCDEGFILSNDGQSCMDINECVSNPCQFTCTNTPGSFTCTCQQGFHLETDGSTCAPDMTETAATSPDDQAEEETQENFTESLTRTTVELQHQSPHTDPPPPDLVNVTHGDHRSNASSTTSFVKTGNSRVIICVLGSVIPLLVLIAVTLAIAMYRCSRSKKEAKKNTTTDGYCWVSSGLDPRLEKLYESILTDDL